MELNQLRPIGPEYLRLVTELLQRQRLADPYAGLYEAADLQWWYTRDPHPSDRDAVVWLSGEIPIVAAAFTRWSATRYNCVVLGDPTYSPAWAFVRARCAELAETAIEMEIDPADDVTAAQAAQAGFTELGETYGVMWLDAANRARPRGLPDGYVMVDRSAQPEAHPMIKRNGPQVEQRLRECSLYDPTLDLAVIAPGGEIAGYALFWADLRTGVGMVEPMRIEEGHAGRGLGGTLLREGLDRLSGRGCTRLKVLHEESNPTAAQLYRGAGFVTRIRATTHRRPAANG